MASKVKPAIDQRMEWVLDALRRGVARACPPRLVGEQDDLVQSAALRLLEWEHSSEQNRLPGPSYAWRLAFNVVIDEVRKTRPEPAGLRGEEATTATVPSAEMTVGLRDCMEGLVGARRVAVFLHLQGFAAEEVARVLRSDVKRAYNLIYRGLADLRRCLAGKGLSP